MLLSPGAFSFEGGCVRLKRGGVATLFVCLFAVSVLFPTLVSAEEPLQPIMRTRVSGTGVLAFEVNEEDGRTSKILIWRIPPSLPSSVQLIIDSYDGDSFGFDHRTRTIYV